MDSRRHIRLSAPLGASEGGPDGALRRRVPVPYPADDELAGGLLPEVRVRHRQLVASTAKTRWQVKVLALGILLGAGLLLWALSDLALRVVKWWTLFHVSRMYGAPVPA